MISAECKIEGPVKLGYFAYVGNENVEAISVEGDFVVRHDSACAVVLISKPDDVTDGRNIKMGFEERSSMAREYCLYDHEMLREHLRKWNDM